MCTLEKSKPPPAREIKPDRMVSDGNDEPQNLFISLSEIPSYETSTELPAGKKRTAASLLVYP